MLLNNAPRGELLTIPFPVYLVWLMLQYMGNTILKMLKPEKHGKQISVKT